MTTPSTEDHNNTMAVHAIDNSRMDVPGVVQDNLIIGSVVHAQDAQLLKHLQVNYVLDVENARKRSLRDALAVETQRIEVDDEFAYEAFRESMLAASRLIIDATSNGKIVLVYCTHGSNESAVVCLAHLVLAEKWTLESAYKHVLQKRPACAPRKAYIDKLKALEREFHGRVTLRSESVGPSMIDLMIGLRGESFKATNNHDEADETCSQATSENAESTVERASIMTNFSMLPTGTSLRETMMIAEADEETACSSAPVQKQVPVTTAPSSRKKNKTKPPKANCIIQ